MWALLLPTGQRFSRAGDRQSPGWNSLWALRDRPLCTWQVPGGVTFSYLFLVLGSARGTVWVAGCLSLRGGDSPVLQGPLQVLHSPVSWSRNCAERPRYGIISEQLGMLKNHIFLYAWLGWEGTSVRGADGRGSLASLTAPFWLLEESLMKALKLQTSLQIVTSLLQALSCQNHDACQVHLAPS